MMHGHTYIKPEEVKLLSFLFFKCYQEDWN